MAKGLSEETIAADCKINIISPVPTSDENLDPVVLSTFPAAVLPLRYEPGAITVRNKSAAISELCKEFCLIDGCHQAVFHSQMMERISNALSNNRELLSLVEQFLDNYSIQGSDLCTSLKDYCLMNPIYYCNLKFTVQAAVVNFLEEIPNLNCKTSTSPVGRVEALFTSFQSTHQQKMVDMLEKLKLGNNKLYEKLKWVKLWRRLLGATFVTAYFSCIIFSFVTTATSSPPLVLALAGLSTVSLGSCTGRLIDWLFNTRVNATTKQHLEIYKSLKLAAALIANHNLDETLDIFKLSKIQFNHLLTTSESLHYERDNKKIKLTINEMEVNLETYQNTIRLLSKKADMFARCIREARKIVIEKVIKDTIIY